MKRRLCRILNIVLHHQFEIYRISALWAKDCHNEQITGDFITVFSSLNVSQLVPLGTGDEMELKVERFLLGKLKFNCNFMSYQATEGSAAHPGSLVF